MDLRVDDPVVIPEDDGPPGKVVTYAGAVDSAGVGAGAGGGGKSGSKKHILFRVKLISQTRFYPIEFSEVDK